MDSDSNASFSDSESDIETESEDTIPFDAGIDDKMPMRECQQKALESMHYNQRGVIQASTGVGKTRIILECVNYHFQHQSAPAILVFPSLIIIQQFLNKYKSLLLPNIQVLVICVESKDKRPSCLDNDTLLITTYCSITKFKEYDNARLVLFDECHNVSTKRMLTTWELFAKHARVFGLTATPLKNKLINMYSCDNMIGGVLYEYNYNQALSDGILCDYIPRFVLYEPPSDITQSLEQQQLQYIADFCQKHQKRRVIVYNQYMHQIANNRTSSKQIAALLPNIKVLHGDMNKDERERVIQWYSEKSSDLRIIANCSVIKEGFDVPMTDTIVFCDDKKSSINVVQSIGRGLRYYETKQACDLLVMVPISQQCLIQSQQDDKVWLASFKRIQHIVKALKRLDVRMEDVLYGKQSIDFIKFEGFTPNIHALIDAKRCDMSRYLKIIIGGEAYAIQRAQSLHAFYQKHNRMPSKDAKDEIERSLGIYMTSMRSAHKGKGKRILYDSVKRILESIPGFQWVVDYEDNAIQKAQQIRDFYQKHNRMPSQIAKDKIERSLGQYVTSMKKAHKGKGRCILYDSAKRILESIPGFKWQVCVYK